jgi:hypothetical protein
MKRMKAHVPNVAAQAIASAMTASPLSHVNSGQRLWLLCSMRVGNSAFRGISAPSAASKGSALARITARPLPRHNKVAAR